MAAPIIWCGPLICFFTEAIASAARTPVLNTAHHKQLLLSLSVRAHARRPKLQHKHCSRLSWSIESVVSVFLRVQIPVPFQHLSRAPLPLQVESRQLTSKALHYWIYAN
jgi:hypothetical protein